MRRDPGREPASPARAVAEALWARATADVPADSAVAVRVDRLLTLVEAGLRRWIGAEGYAALLSRAVAETLATTPALATIPDLTPDRASGGAAPSAGDAETRAAIIDLLVTMMRLLGAVVGEAMAIRLLELSGTPSTRGSAGAETNTTPT
jgi:hypothetical protein